MGFQKGQTIRAIRSTESAYGHRFAKGRELVVTNPDMYGRPSSHPHHRLGVNTPAGAAEAPSASEWVVNPADFELVELDPSKVKAGDTVTVERDGGRLPDQEVMVVGESGMGYTTVILRGGVQVYITGPDAWTLTDHQPAPEPKPQPPTRAGSFVLANGLGGLPKVPLFLTRQGWITRYDSKLGWTVEALQERGFEVIHDAGKDA